MSNRIEDTYCIEVGNDVWCAVLGNHYPNMVNETGSALFVSSVDAVAPAELAWFTQRLCDQHKVRYDSVMVRAPTCPECLRIKALMVEFVRKPDEVDDEDEASGSNTGSADVVQGEQLGTP